MSDEELEREFVRAGTQIVDTLKHIGEVIDVANASFGPHVVIAQEAADRSERIKAYQDAAGPISRYAAKLFTLEKSLRDQIEDYTNSFEVRFRAREPGVEVLVPMLTAQVETVSTFKRQFSEQHDAAALISSHRAEPHLTAAFGDLALVLTKIVEDAAKVVSFAKRSLKRLEGG